MRFSIVTPSFNQLDWLRLCAASVRDQVSLSTINDQRSTAAVPSVAVEHIVQDAGTAGIEEAIGRWGGAGYPSHQPSSITHASLAVASHPLQQPSFSLMIRSEKDHGMYDAINRGLARGTGELCAWLNCDEQYLPGALARVAGFFDSHPQVDVAFGDALLIGIGFEILSYRTTVLPSVDHTRLVHLNTLSCSTFFRRSILENGHWLADEWKTIGDAVWVEGMLRGGVRMARLGFATSAFQFTGRNLGASEAAATEVRQWAQRPDAPPRWRRWPARLSLWMRKARVGGYRRRRIETALYTMDSPTERVLRSARSVGSAWPRV